MSTYPGAFPEADEEVKLLSVAFDRLTAWSRPGLLAIGDAAHAMSPIGGIGINLAIQDAVAAANALAGPMPRAWISILCWRRSNVVGFSLPVSFRRDRKRRRTISFKRCWQADRSRSRSSSGCSTDSLCFDAFPGRLIGLGVRRERVRIRLSRRPRCEARAGHWSVGPAAPHADSSRSDRGRTDDRRDCAPFLRRAPN